MTRNAPSRDDVERMFRERGDIGPDSSLLLRSRQPLFQDGKPVGSETWLFAELQENERCLLAILSYTQKNRLVFRPVLPRTANMICPDETVTTPEHVTLEFPSERTHVTGHNAAGERVHGKPCWRLRHFRDRPLALWLMFLLRLSVLGTQDRAVQRRVHIPPSDVGRRLAEFIKRPDTKVLHLPPAEERHGDYVFCSLCLEAGPIGQEHVPATLLLLDPPLDKMIDDLPTDTLVPVGSKPLKIGPRILHIALACPPGKLKEDVFLGMPSQRRDQGRRPG